MKLAKYKVDSGNAGVALVDGTQLRPLKLGGKRQYQSLFDILEADEPSEVVDFLIDGKAKPLDLATTPLLPPIDGQEVWAAGVTYKRSQTARMEESEAAADCYDRVYNSLRPDLFFKATPHRVAGHGQPLRIRRDATWSVPEPELALVLNSHMQLVGYTIGNDMSSRDIEGENPLYLPQAKLYNECCGLGPWITLEGSGDMPPRSAIEIKLSVMRGEKEVFTGATDVGQMARTFDDLLNWLERDNTFPYGGFLLTGTGVVPDADFTLHAGDIVSIEIDGIGTLTNPIVQG